MSFEDESEMHRTGRCLCGAITFSVDGPMRDVVVCLCKQCQQWTGYIVAATAAPEDKVNINGQDNITWYQATDMAERGFCRICGSSLFWRPSSGSHFSIMAGSMDNPTGLKISEHIFVDSKADYYEI